MKVKDYAFRSGGRKTDFFHWAKDKVVLDQFHPEIKDRREAHIASLKDGTYDRAWTWFRMRKDKVLAARMFYVAEDPVSSQGSGDQLVEFELSLEAKVLQMELVKCNSDVASELSGRFPELRQSCPEEIKNGCMTFLRYFVFEDSGVDLIDYYEGKQWFQLLRPNAIEEIRLKYNP